MFDRARLLAPLAGLALLVGIAAPAPRASADMVQTIDLKWLPWPEGAPQPMDTDPPSQDALAASDETKILDATYEAVKLSKGGTKPAAQVVQLASLDAARNETFAQAMNDASSSLLVEASDGFRAAAGELKDYAKQEALYRAMQAAEGTGDAGRATAAADELLGAFPKTFFFCDAQILKAKIAAIKGDLAAAGAALDAVKNAAGMNVRDSYRAQFTKVSLTLELQRKYEQAASEYRVLIGSMEREKEAAAVLVSKQRCQVGLGNCLLALRKDKEARPYFLQATESRDADVLAGAYNGLGDVALTEARALKDAKQLPEAKAKLENEAILHYLRVSLKYRTGVTDTTPVLRAMENQAAVFIALFDMSGGKDCEAADRACRTYAELVRMLPEGSAQRRTIGRAYQDIDKRRDACKPPAPASGKPPLPAE